MTIAKLNPEELDLIEEAMIALGQRLNNAEPTVTNNDKKIAVSTALTKLNTIRKCSIVDSVDVSPAHGG